jgi:uncharacterized protein (DUF488 family)
MNPEVHPPMLSRPEERDESVVTASCDDVAVSARLDHDGPSGSHQSPESLTAGLWVGSVGYEKFKDSRDFASMLAAEGVERLIDVRELPISRRRGYAKTALADALAGAGVQYVHLRALGNPKPYRDLYKSGRVEQGRERYMRFLLGERRDALDGLVRLLGEKRTALMCVEHDATTCHRNVIFEALRVNLGLDLDIADLA